MKILHIIASRGWGGAENFDVYLAKKQIEREHSAYLFIHSFNEKLKNILQDNNVPLYSIFNPERKNIFAINKIIKICISCSLNEPFGINNLEYMFMKKPRVAANSGGIPEVFGDTNILMPPKDPPKLKDALKLYIENKSRRDEEAMKGFERARNVFASDICFNKTMDVWMCAQADY